MYAAKSILQSKTFWTCLVGAVAEGLTLSGVHVLDDPTTQASVVGIITAVGAAFFRQTATRVTYIWRTASGRTFPHLTGANP